MSPPNPCCGGSLQRGTTIVAIVDIVLNVISIISLLVVLVMGILFGAADSNIEVPVDIPAPAEPDGLFATIRLALIIISGIALILVIIRLVMSIFLLKGAKERNVNKCKAWLIYTVVYWILSAISVFFGFYPAIFELVLKLYFMWVVYAFMKEVQMEPPAYQQFNP